MKFFNSIPYLKRFSLLVSTVFRFAYLDPTLFALQLCRRLPFRVRRRMGTVSPSFLGDTTAGALWFYLADIPAVARGKLAARANVSKGVARLRGPWPATVSGRLAAVLGMPLPGGASDSQRAYAAWQVGDLAGALALARGVQRKKYEAELATLCPGFVADFDRRDLGAGFGSAGVRGKKLRVLHVLTNSLPYTRSGYSYRCHQVLRAQQAAGIDVLACTRLGYPTSIGRPFAPDVSVVDGVTYHRFLPVFSPLTVAGRISLQARELARLVAGDCPDVLHTTTHYPNALVVRAVAEYFNIPWVYEMRGQLENSWVSRFPEDRQNIAISSLKYRLWRRCETRLARAANAVVVLSQVQKEELVTRGVAREKIWVVPNGWDGAPVPAKGEARKLLGFGDSELWVGSVSAIVDYEGLEYLVEAVAQLRESHPSLRLAIVGDGGALPALKRQAAQLGLDDIAVFPGRVGAEQARAWSAALDIFVIPRKDLNVTRMVTPIKGMLPLAGGTPVLASDLPALREVVPSGLGGDFFAADSVTALVQALDMWLEKDLSLCAQGAREFADQHRWDSLVLEYFRCYRAILEGDL